MLDTASPLAAIYSTSTMEHHHFNQTVTILQQVEVNVSLKRKKNDFVNILGRAQYFRKVEQSRIQASVGLSKALYISNRFGVIFPQSSKANHPYRRGKVFVECARAPASHTNNCHDSQ